MIKLIDILNEVNQPQYKIYVDMDGVIADFDQRFKDLSGGIPPKEYETKFGKKKFWDLIDKDNYLEFWTDIKKMEDANTLMDFVSQYDYELLTAPSIKKQSEYGKKIWIQIHVGDLFQSPPKVNFKSAKTKHEIKPNLSEFDILIDDREQTINNWNNSGGIGILHTSAASTIKQLKALGL